MGNPLNENEQKFIEKLQRAECYVPGDEDLEIDYIYADPDTIYKIDGWYAMRYNGTEAILLEEYSTKPIITEEEADELGIDVEKCLNKYGCYIGG